MGLPRIGVEAVVDNLDGYKKGMAAIESTTAQAGEGVSKATSKFDEMGQKSNHLGNIIDVAFGNIIAGAVFKATSAITGFIGGVFEAGQQGILVEKQLNAVLTSTKGIAGVTAKDVNKLADSLSNTTKFSDDEVVSAQNLLLTFTKIHSDVFPRTTAATLDMAQAMGMDLRSASLVVGKALNDPVAGVTALQREGVKLTAEQKQLVAQFVATGQTAKAQGVILTELETEFGGSAAAAATPWDILNNKLGKFQETIGRALIPALNGALDAFMPFINEGLKGASDFLENVVGPAFAKTGQVLDNFFLLIGKGNEGPLQALGDSITTYFPTGTIHDIGKAIGDLGGFMQSLGPGGTAAAVGVGLFGLALGKALVASVISTIAGAISSLAGGLLAAAGGAVAAALPFVLLGGAIALLVAAITNFQGVIGIFASGGALGGFGDAVRKGVNDVAVKAATEINTLISRIQVLLAVLGASQPGANSGGDASHPILHNGVGATADMRINKGNGPTSAGLSDQRAGEIAPLSGKAIIDTAVTDLNAAAPALTAAAGDAGAKAGTFIGERAKVGAATASVNLQQGIKDGTAWISGPGAGLASAAGGAVIAGLIGGINANAGGVEGALSAIINAAINRIKSQLGIASPSKVFAGFGANMMAGWEKGIMSNANMPIMATATVSQNVIASAGGGSYNDSSSRTNIYNLGLQPYQTPGGDNSLQGMRG